MKLDHRCRGTNARYALRCRRTARRGHLTCGIHADQEEYWLNIERQDAERGCSS